MGIPYALASMIVQEHKNRPITGKILLIGRQTIDMKVQTAINLVEGILGQVRTDNPLLDQTTAARDYRHISRDTISDVGFFSLFSDASVTAVDVTDYEGAEIVHDMCTELPSHMIEKYDFVFNGSCLDNIFDVSAALRNFGLCLKPGGRLFQIEAASSTMPAYIVFSPEWFLDFFVTNNWENGDIYICRVGNELGGFRFMKNPWDVYRWRPFFPEGNDMNYIKRPRSLIVGMEFIVSIAQRGSGTVHVNPIQARYRPSETFAAQMPTMVRWLRSDRTRFAGHESGPCYPYLVPDGLKEAERCYEYCGTIRHPEEPS